MAVIAVLPMAFPVSDEPVSKASVFLPEPQNTTELLAPLMLPELVTELAVPCSETPYFPPEIVPPVLLVTVPGARNRTTSLVAPPVITPELVTVPPAFR